MPKIPRPPREKPLENKELDELEIWVSVSCLMLVEKKPAWHILVKMPIVLICLALLLVDFSSGDEPPEFSGMVRLNVLRGLHLLVFLEIFWNNSAFSKGYYTCLTLVMAWLFNPWKSTDARTLLIQSEVYQGSLFILSPYLLAAWVAWRQKKQTNRM